MSCLYLIVPCYNEEECIQDTVRRLSDKLSKLMENKIVDDNSRILYVNDGSSDRTWELLKKAAEKDPSHISAVSLSRNEGHQNALWCGLNVAYPEADITISIDADLQQDIDAIEKFVEKYNEGNDVVLGIRKSRNTDGFMKKMSATLYYKLMDLLGTKTVPNHADYRLLSRKALSALLEYGETQLFLRGIVANLGFNTGYVYFDVKPREKGSSKYSVSKMMSLAFNGITSLSIRPMQFMSLLGVIALIVSVIMIIKNIITFFRGEAVVGWASTVCTIWMLGGINLLCMGLLGEYIGKIYLEAKHRPVYFIMDSVNVEKEDKKDDRIPRR
ncbi:MAG: glycosyltransferase family 2 protein [Lachnospiraceae bacterium]|nr:glycosyltransferase family 2 protein [Lachnospiraceae bacterium]